MARKRLKAGAIIVAAGRGSRFGGRTPKQFVRLRGKPMLLHSLNTIRSVPAIGQVVIVTTRAHLPGVQRMIRAARTGGACVVVAGGSRRQDSVYNGLRAFTSAPNVVLIHDAARPLVKRGMITGILRFARRYKAVVAAVPVTDTLKKEGPSGFAGSTVPRAGLWSAQTPQVFRYDLLIKAHEKARKHLRAATDDAALVERMGIRVRLFPGSPENIKVTTRSDLRRAEIWLKLMDS